MPAEGAAGRHTPTTHPTIPPHLPAMAGAGLTIAGPASAGGVGVETVRYCHRRGLIAAPERSPDGGLAGGIRRYGAEDAHRSRFIRAAPAAGFTLGAIGELLAPDATDDRARARELARQRITALDAKIAELATVRTALSRLAEACADGEDGPCPIIAAFASVEKA